MHVEMVPLTELRHLEENPRKHSEKQIIELVKSLEQFGQYRPLVVDEDGVVLAGNGLLTALQRAGHEKAAVYRAEGLSPVQRKKLILADNKLGDLSLDDFNIIDKMLAEINDFVIPGYDEDTLRSLLGSAEEQLAEAEEYGILSDDAVEEREERAEKIERKMQEAEEAAESSEDDEVEPSVNPSARTENTSEQPAEGDACPTCGRAW